ncbi:Galactose mutarotase-like superfamily protein [Euphorbia peplus]|nr:Galactose mutarotase-like superfamily protein [Euphorbia peplus]
MEILGKIPLIFCTFLVLGLANAQEKPATNSKGDNAAPAFYELKKGNMSLKFTNYGATLVSFKINDKAGKPIDIVLGYDTIKEYQEGKAYFGAVVGRVANRIAGGQFKLKGQTYKLPVNDGKNTLHGGPKGYSTKIWKVTKHKQDGPSPFITFTYRSADGDEGFPGALRVVTTYTLLENNQFNVFFKARMLDKKVSPVSLAQHTYWNLGGHNSGDILNEKVRIFGEFYTAVDDQLIPTGQTLYARGTPYDFTEEFLEMKPVGKRIALLPKGYDINFILSDFDVTKTRLVARVQNEKTGIKMEMSSNAPGLQFYSANLVNNVKGKEGATYNAHSGLCLETQWYPDYVNHPSFPQSIVEQGKLYKHHMLFNFTYL